MVPPEDVGMIRLIIPAIGEEEIQAVTAVLRSGYLVQGEQVRRFEQLVAEYLGVKYALAVSSGTAALHLALLAAGVGPGDEVIVPDFTFPATANVVELAGAKPVLVDIDLASYNIDVSQIRPFITEQTRVIMPVHLFGQPADMGPIMEIAREYNLLVIEDAACALGAEYRGCKCGSIGHIGCFSFHPRKAITTGEGGIVATDDEGVAERVLLMRNHGMKTVKGKNHLEMPGFNYRMTDFQGALGVVQMGRLESILTRRIELAELYDQALVEIASVVRPSTVAEVKHIWQSYVVLLDEKIERDLVLRNLKEQGIEVTIGTYALSAQPPYAGLKRAFPNSHRAYAQGLCLPLHTQMSAEDVERVAVNLSKIAEKLS